MLSGGYIQTKAYSVDTSWLSAACARGRHRLFWYPTPKFKFMANYVRVLDLEGGDFDGAELDAFLLRAQAYW